MLPLIPHYHASLNKCASGFLNDMTNSPTVIAISGERCVWSFGFGYGATWVAFILIFLSTVLLSCDRDSEEVFYQEKMSDYDEEEEEEEEA